jgi:hypothetical protein
VDGLDPEVGRPGRAEQPEEPLAHLAGGLVGEGDGQDVPGEDALLLHQPGDPVDDDAGLAAAGAGQDQQRPVAVDHRLALGLVQVLEEVRVGVVGGHRGTGR